MTTRMLFREASADDTFGGDVGFPIELCWFDDFAAITELGELLPPDIDDGEQARWYPLVAGPPILSIIAPDELGRGLTHADCGECCVGWRWLESWGGYGDEFNGKLTGTGDMPDDEGCD